MSIMEKKHSRHRNNGEGGYGIIGGKVRMVRERESEEPDCGEVKSLSGHGPLL